MTAAADPVLETRSYLRRLLAAARRGVDREAVEASVYDNGGLSGRYLMMTVISAAIAALGLMLSSPAVVIGAMLVSPMMGPIVALGFSLALLDWRRLKQSLTCLAVGMAVALTVAILLTLLSPLKEPTSEILARTRPNFFDLLIAVFSGVAGAYAVIRQRGETIIGVAIATALMPPVATVGFGIGTGDLSISVGAFYLFMTNLVAIALSATLTAGFYGFRPRLRERPSPWRGLAVLAVFVLLSIPLVISLRAIGLESQATAETRTAVADIFAGADSRVTLLDARSEGRGVVVSALVSTKKLVADAQGQLQDRLSAALHVPVTATLDQIVVADPQAASRAVQASAGGRLGIGYDDLIQGRRHRDMQGRRQPVLQLFLSIRDQLARADQGRDGDGDPGSDRRSRSPGGLARGPGQRGLEPRSDRDPAHPPVRRRPLRHRRGHGRRRGPSRHRPPAARRRARSGQRLCPGGGVAGPL
jgi:uncharacterized hydrophobic protein (TIGR00271 family)